MALKKWKRGVVPAAGALIMLLAAPVSAAKYGYKIDAQQMKTLEKEAERTFPVIITEKKVVEECLETKSFDEPTDVLSFTVENQSADDIYGLTIKFVAYDDDEMTTDIKGGLLYSVGTESPEIHILNKEDLGLAPGESCTISTAVDFAQFSGVRAMIAEYRNEDGSLVKNPAYPEWENMAFGLVADNVMELD